MIFLILLVVPAILALVLFVFFRGFSWREIAAQLLAQVAIAAVSALIVSCVKTSDTEVWNGRVASKERVQVGCSHSYQCMCMPVCTGAGTSQTCTTVCQTCYQHPHDFDWRLVTTNGEAIEIERLDPQGIGEPPRWTSASVGEPTAVLHDYENFVKAVPDAFFQPRPGSRAFADSIPAYPIKVRDYHRIDRLVLSPGAKVADARAWNEAIDSVAADLGASRQANIIVVFAPPGAGHDFFRALEEAWVGGKKNDVILVLCVGSEGSIAWADVMAWTIRPEFKEKLRSDVMALPRADDPKAVLDRIRADVSELHQRKPMRDFAYLKSAIVPSLFQWIFVSLISLFAAVMLAFFFHTSDPFDDADRRIRRRGRDVAIGDAELRKENARLAERVKDLSANVPMRDYRTIGRE